MSHLLLSKNRSFLLLPFLLLVLLNHAIAQEGECRFSFSGTIIDGENGKGFAFANVFVKEQGKGTVTTDSGNFTISGLCPGKVTIEFSALGYKKYSAIYNLPHSPGDVIILHTDTCELESVTIHGEKAEDFSTITKTVLEGKDLERTRGTSLGEVLKEIPGVNSFKTGNSISKPVIHGLHSNRVLLLNAGLRQEGQQWGNEHAPEIDPFVSDKITVVKGAAGVKYGSDAIAGVVIVEPRSLPELPGINSEINLVGMSGNRQGTSSGLLEGMYSKKFPLKWRLQGTYSKAGNVRTPSYYQSNTGFEERNFSYALGFDKKWFSSELFYSQFNTELGIFSGAHIGSLGDLKNAIEKSEPAVKSGFSYEIKRPFQKVEHELIRAKLSAVINRAGKVNLLLGRQFNDRSEYDVPVRRSSITNSNTPQLQFKLTTLSADLSFDHKTIKNITGTMGASYLNQSNIWQGRFLIPNFINNTYGFFVFEKWSKHHLELETGIRYDSKQTDVYENKDGIVTHLPLTFSGFSGTAGALYRMNSRIAWRTNIGTSWRAPNVNELFSRGLHHGAAAIEYGNPAMGKEQSYKLISTLEGKGAKSAFEVSLYYNYITGFIYLKPDLVYELTIRGAFPTFTYTQTDAGLYGSDVYGSVDLTKSVSLSLKGSFVLAENITTRDFLINVPPARYSPAFVYRPQFINSNLNAYLRLTVNRTEHQNRYPQNSDYADPPPAYTLFDSEIGSDINFGKQKLSLILQVHNIFDQKYRDYMNRFRYFTDEMGRNISIKIKLPLQIYRPGSGKVPAEK